MTKRLLIWNRNSGRARQYRDLDIRLGLNDTQIVEMTRDTDLKSVLLGEPNSKAIETVIVAGGDGTVNAVVNALMLLDEATRPRLAILPLGTANDFAGTLHIPDDIDEAIGLLDTTQCIPVDVVRIGADGFERYYANVAAGGNSVRVTEEMTEELKAKWGALCYLRGGVEVLADLKTFHVTADCDGERFANLDSWAVLVANGRTNAGRIVVAPQASPVDGLLDVILIRDGNVLDMIDIVSGVLLGNFLECDQVIFRQVKRLQLHSEPSMRFTLDGEVIDQEPVQFDVVPGAIRMYVGANFLLEHQQNLVERPTHIFHAHGKQNA